MNQSTYRWGVDVYMRDGIQLDSLFVSNVRIVFAKIISVQSCFHLIQLKLTMLKKMDSMKYRPFMVINMTLDICAAIEGKVSSPINDMWQKTLAKYSNAFQKCPLRGHLYVKEHTEESDHFPPIIPAGDYYAHNLYYTKYKNADRIVSQSIIHAEVVPVGIERF